MSAGDDTLQRVAIIIVSDSRSAGEAPDTVGPELAAQCSAAGWTVVAHKIVPDDYAAIASTLSTLADAATTDLIVTSGGTGCGPRDVTPEATRSVLDQEIPGLGEMQRAAGARTTQRAWLSRGTGGLCGGVLIVNVPGSRAGAVTGVELVLPLARHVLAVAGGASHAAP